MLDASLTHRRLSYPWRSCVPAELRCVSNSESMLTLRPPQINSLNTGVMPKKIPRAPAAEQKIGLNLKFRLDQSKDRRSPREFGRVGFAFGQALSEFTRRGVWGVRS